MSLQKIVLNSGEEIVFCFSLRFTFCPQKKWLKKEAVVPLGSVPVCNGISNLGLLCCKDPEIRCAKGNTGTKRTRVDCAIA